MDINFVVPTLAAKQAITEAMYRKGRAGTSAGSDPSARRLRVGVLS